MGSPEFKIKNSDTWRLVRKKLFSIYSTTQECDIIVGQKIVGQKGVETDEKKLSK